MIIPEEIRKSGVLTSLLGFKPSVNSIEDYNKFVNQGFEPMLDWRFEIKFSVRLELQLSIFGRNIHSRDDYFFRWIWDRSETYCREYLTQLYEFNAVHMAHIIPKGAHTEMRHDTRNIIILSKPAHTKWDSEKNSERAKMNIWPGNKRIIQILTKDYQL